MIVRSRYMYSRRFVAQQSIVLHHLPTRRPPPQRAHSSENFGKGRAFSVKTLMTLTLQGSPEVRVVPFYFGMW
jgi:hypothetical protein